MSALRATGRITGSTINGNFAAFRYTAPANQKVWVIPTFTVKDATAAGFCELTARVSGTADGTTSAVTMRKENTLDTETVQGTPVTFSVQPTDDGNVIRSAAGKTNDRISLKPILVPGGGSVTIWLVATAINTFVGEILIEQ